MNEKKTIWDKTKEFFKKNWVAFVAFGSGVITSLFFYFSNGFSGRNKFRDNRVGEELGKLDTGLTETGDKISSLGNENRDNIVRVEEQRDEISNIREGHKDITGSAEKIGNGIQNIKQLIEAERKRLEEIEDKK